MASPVSDVVVADRPAARHAPVLGRFRDPRWAAGVLGVLAVCLQQPATAFAYDAGSYWGGATAVLDGGSVFDRGLLSVRGVLTSFLYLPAAVGARIAGEAAAGPSVLVENAVLIAVIGAVLLPALVSLWRPATAAVVWACTAGAVVLLRGLAPFPLTDLWAAALVLSSVALLARRGWPSLLLAGLAAGLAFHLRPAALVPVVLLVAAVLVARRGTGLWLVGGTALALVPQFVLNRWRGTSWLPWPEATAALTQVQARYASFVVRYDTVMSGQVGDARLFYCSPRMAHALNGQAPDSTGGLVVAYLAHLPEAALLSLQKVGAALHWPLSTPYLVHAPVVDGVFAVVVTAVAVVGALMILSASFRAGWRSLTLPRTVAVLVWAGSLLTLTTSATETRFALPVLLVGLAGCALLVADRPGLPRSRGGRIWVAATVVIFATVFAAGVAGLQHPVEGDVTVQQCAAS